jgi:hypothetical protein
MNGKIYLEQVPAITISVGLKRIQQVANEPGCYLNQSTRMQSRVPSLLFPSEHAAPLKPDY